MTDIRYRLPNEVAAQLKISPSTLRRWSNEFADFLSDPAGRPAAGGQTAHRRYTDEDLETLMTIKGLLAEGLSYIQVGKRLEALRLRQTTASGTREAKSDAVPVTALGPSLLDTSPVAPAVAVLADTLHTVAEGQQILLGSQQANRDLLTVVLQDNFSLKEENAKLRDRMLELERDMAEMRRLDAARRETMEARLQKLEELPRHPLPNPQHQQRPRSQRSGCLGQLFGSLS
jgi:DNA-binding transcriptional MerR regulator